MKTAFDENKAKEALAKGIPQATATLEDKEKLEKLIANLENKIDKDKLNEALEIIPLLIKCIKSYIKKEYTEIPVGSILAIVSALIYWVSPIDIIPDCIPGVGYIDDAAVVLACLKMVKTDLDEYKIWLEAKEQQQDIQE